MSTMSIRSLTLGLLLGMLLTVSARAAGQNVVLFVTDDQSPDAGCYGNAAIKTPNMDRLAADGTRLDFAFCTTASCSASRSVILTGLFNHANAQYGHEHSYHHFRTYDNVKSLPVLLGAAGYRTARIGKYHVGPEAVYHFDRFLPGNARSPVAMAENCREFINADDSKPFFLYFCTADPHRSGDQVDSVPEKPNAFGNRPQGYPGVTPVHYDPQDVIVPPFLPDTPACRAELAQYYESVSRVDQGLGRLVEILQKAGKYDDTMILFISDHGMAFPGAKTNVYEPGLRSPCIVRRPKQRERGGASKAMVSWIDITPTILDFAGALDEKHKFHGRSFLRAIDEQQPAGWDEIYASHTFHEITMYYPMRVVRTRRHKLIWNLAHPLPFPFASDLWAAPTWQDVYRRGTDAFYGPRTVQAYLQRPQFELFDLESDPHEAKNLAGDPEYAELLAELKGQLKAFQKRTSDPWLLKWDYE
ncbi:MAG TPA: sulfatase [Pirellulales bacterium]|nr:sulfatase [Pirellulales bacterium]